MSQLTRITNSFKFQHIKMWNTRLPNLRYLPVELWIVIIEIVVNSTVPTFGNCKFDKFPEFLHSWKHKSVKYSEYVKYPESERGNASNYESINLRLVCRTWSEIVHHICEQKSPIIIAEHPSVFLDLRQSNIKYLRIFDFNGLWNDFAYPLPRDLVQVARNISTIVLSVDNASSNDMPKGLLSLLLHHHHYFPNVRSLSIDGYIRIASWLLSGVERGFPQLTFLRLSGRSIDKHRIYLPNLKIVELSPYLDAPDCDFPALTHASLGIPNPWDNPHIRLFHRYIPHLESLVIWSHGFDFIYPFDLIVEFRNLRLFGASTRTLQVIMPWLPKHNRHSLEHIWILDWTDATTEPINLILTNLKGLKRLTITPGRILPTTTTLHDIREKCRMKGVILEETTGMVNFNQSDLL